MSRERTVNADAARRLAISVQRLAGPTLPALQPPKVGREDLLDTVRAIRCLQLDPISVVARSHQLVLWSRVGPFPLHDLDVLLWKDRSLFEYWAHRASIVLTEDYPIHRLLMRGYPKGDAAHRVRARTWMDANRTLQRDVLRRLRQDGPLPSRAFEDRSRQGWRSSGWTNERNVSRMLDMLWIQGRIMVAGRDGLQKLWDLSERCLPEWTPREVLSESGVVRRAVEHSLRALGVGTPKHIQEHFTIGRYPGLEPALARLGKEGRVEQLRVIEGGREWPGRWFVHVDHLPLLERIRAGDWSPRTTLLSPFDNLIINRTRTELLFDFEFRMEIYVPKQKRRHGYYVMPILHGDRLIGRVDPVMSREDGRLWINAVHAEATARMTASAGRAVAQAIEELATFLGASRVGIGSPVPEAWRRTLS